MNIENNITYENLKRISSRIPILIRFPFIGDVGVEVIHHKTVRERVLKNPILPETTTIDRWKSIRLYRDKPDKYHGGWKRRKR